MPNIKSAKKRMKTGEKSRQENRSARSKITTLRGSLDAAVSEGDKGTCQKLFPEYCSALDKAAKKGAIKANTASRRKSRMARKLAS